MLDDLEFKTIYVGVSSENSCTRVGRLVSASSRNSNAHEAQQMRRQVGRFWCGHSGGVAMAKSRKYTLGM